MIDLSIIIVSFNTKELTLNCLRSIEKTIRGLNYEIIVVDNASKDDSAAVLEKISKIKLIKNKDNVGFGPANNQGILVAKGRYILLLNSDTLLFDNILGEMVNWMEKHPKAGIASCSLKSKDGSLQGTGGFFPSLGKIFCWMLFLDDIPYLDKLIKPYHPMHSLSPFYKGEGYFKKQSTRDWITGAFFLLRDTVAKDVGLFDRDYFMYVEEVDYCYRARRLGWEIWYLPQWNILHYGGASSATEFPILQEYKGLKIFYKKHMPFWQLPILIFLLKIGALLRMIIFGLIKGKDVAKIYAKAFSLA